MLPGAAKTDFATTSKASQSAQYAGHSLGEIFLSDHGL
jgi:hypothetical protein